MKCIFVATTYLFSVQYHAWASVQARADKAWEVVIEGSGAWYRGLVEPGARRHGDSGCAVFVPVAYNDRAAGLLITAFTSAHPGVIPRDVVFDFPVPGVERWSRFHRWPASRWARYLRRSGAQQY